MTRMTAATWPLTAPLAPVWLSMIDARGNPSSRLLGQHLVVTSAGHIPLPEIQALIADYHVGSVVLRAADLRDAAQTVDLTQRLQQFAKSSRHPEPLLIGIEQEGGLVSHFSDGLQATHFPGPLCLAAIRTPSTTSKVAGAIGKELASVGINWEFAPVHDHVNDLTEPLEASRRFGDQPGVVSDHTSAFARGLQASGVASCATETLAAEIQGLYGFINEEASDEQALKSFEQVDFGHPASDTKWQSFDSVQLSPSTHEYDDPVRASRAIALAIKTIIRKPLGFKGPVVSNCSDIPPESNVCIKHAPLRALLSGSDMVRLADDHATQIASIHAIYAAVASGHLTATAIATAADRVSSLKSRCLSWQSALNPPSNLSFLLPSHAVLAQNAYRGSTTVLSRGPSPLVDLPAASILLLLTPTVPSQPRQPGSPTFDPFEPLGKAISRLHPRTRHVPYTLSAGLTSTHMVFLLRAAAVVLVLCNSSSALTEAQGEVISSIQQALRRRDTEAGAEPIRKVVLGAGDPRDLKDEMEGWWAACCYEHTRGALEAVAEVLVGEREATGTLPVKLG